MSRFLHGSDEERNSMFKLIPHCAKGSWVVSQSVGTTPVILGRKLVSTLPLLSTHAALDASLFPLQPQPHSIQTKTQTSAACVATTA